MFKLKRKPKQPQEAAEKAPKAQPRRRRKSDADRRETLLRVRLNDAEHERLKALASDAGMTPSALIRDHLGAVEVRNRDDERQRVGLLNRINANLNMIARWVNVHRGAADAVEVVAHLQAIQRAVEVVANHTLDQEAEIELLRSRLAVLETPQEPEQPEAKP